VNIKLALDTILWRDVINLELSVPVKTKGNFLASSSRIELHGRIELILMYDINDRLCGLVVRVLGYRSVGPGSIPGTTRKKVVGLERGSLSLVSTHEVLLNRNVASPVYKTENTAVGNRHADHVAPSIRKSRQSLRRQAAVARSV
jgi:hypothetical protein